MSRAQSHILAARAALAEARKLLDNVSAELDRLQVAVRAELAEGVPTPLQTPLEDLPEPSEHRRAHRTGFPSKIDTDPELRAFILARIDRMGFVPLAAEVAQAFPPKRRVGKSGIYDWWRKNHPR
ncbi:hypothetical protein [Rhodovulum euryhalinum]|uniref:Uncharacterized protein n=1 Tax=Rhodovulum euryhalinum TaxID=35805 RepID=A0A4R2KIN9_9RHOB|nr:hypothetical protein [Rhodovulum euryhalinum]TCO73064.1 hypothetical protein EV655_103293 [Rhodovulum euryhalinum]